VVLLDQKEGSGQVKKRTQEVIGNVQQIMEDSPTTSIRHLSQQVDLSVEITGTKASPRQMYSVIMAY
jgi:hypothetical protein